MESKNGYRCQKQVFSFTKVFPGKIKPVHGFLYWWICEKNNSLKWIEVFELPTKEAMLQIGIKDRQTFTKTLSELESWGFIHIISKSTNQAVPNKIELIFEAEKDASAYGKTPQAKFKEHILPMEKTRTSIDNTNRRRGKKPLAEQKKPVGDSNKSPNNSGNIEPLNLLKPSLNKKETRADISDLIIKAFEEVFPDYIILNTWEAKKMAKQLIKIFRELNEDITNEDLLEDLKNHFIKCKGITEKWYMENMSLSLMVTKFNEIHNILKDISGVRKRTYNKAHGIINIEELINERRRHS